MRLVFVAFMLLSTNIDANLNDVVNPPEVIKVPLGNNHFMVKKVKKNGTTVQVFHKQF